MMVTESLREEDYHGQIRAFRNYKIGPKADIWEYLVDVFQGNIFCFSLRYFHENRNILPYDKRIKF